MVARTVQEGDSKPPPAYRLRKGYSQAIVTLTDSVTGKRKDYWLGEYGSPGSREMYHRVLSRWESLNRRHPPEAPSAMLPEVAHSLPVDGNGSHPPMTQPLAFRGLTVGAVIVAYREHVDATFKPATCASIYMVLNLLDQVFGKTAAEQFGPAKLRLLREQMIKGAVGGTPGGGGGAGDEGRKPWSRSTVNKAVHQVCAMFRWAASHEMLPVGIHTHLKTVPALRRGQSDAKDYDPIRPVPPEVVEKTKPFLSRQVKALVELQLLTGARGGELLRLRPMDVHKEDGGKVWTIQPLDHKTAHHGHERTLFLGPKAQLVLAPFLTNRSSEGNLKSARSNVMKSVRVHDPARADRRW